MIHGCDLSILFSGLGSKEFNEELSSTYFSIYLLLLLVGAVGHAVLVMVVVCMGLD